MSDTISRQAAIDAMEQVKEQYFDRRVIIGKMQNVVSNLPSAQPERKRGRWIYGEDNPGTGRDGWFCSECEHFEMWDYSVDMKSAELNLPNYCPNCGADMRGEQDE